MTITEVVAVVLGLYGAVVSTVLAVREIRKDKRQLKITVQHNYWTENCLLILSNTGVRPVTIVSMTLEIGNKEGRGEPIPSAFIFEDREGNQLSTPFPITLNDGDIKQLYFSNIVGDDLISNKLNASIEIVDADHNRYTKYERRAFDIKWGHYFKYPNDQNKPMKKL